MLASKKTCFSLKSTLKPTTTFLGNYGSNDAFNHAIDFDIQRLSPLYLIYQGCYDETRQPCVEEEQQCAQQAKEKEQWKVCISKIMFISALDPFQVLQRTIHWACKALNMNFRPCRVNLQRHVQVCEFTLVWPLLESSPVQKKQQIHQYFATNVSQQCDCARTSFKITQFKFK